MKRTIVITIHVIILVSLIMYCVYYVLSDCTGCFNSKIDHVFIILLGLIVGSLGSLSFMLSQPAYKKTKTKNTTHNSITKNKIKNK